MINRCFWYLSTLVDTALLSSIFIWARSFSLSTFVDTSLLFALHIRILILVFVHFSGHIFTSLDIYLSVLFQFVHFNGHSLAILNIYLSALSQFVHFSGHTSFNCITWWNAGFNTCPLLWTPIFQLHCMTEHWFQHLSTLVDTPLPVTLHDKTWILVLVHFNGHATYCLHVCPNII